MTPRDAADTFVEIATLLELKGENPFKTRAYHQAALLLRRHQGHTLESFLKEVENGAVKGIGAQLKDKILTLAETGKLPYLEKLKDEFPEGLLELLRLPGLGPKKVETLYRELNVESIEVLKSLCVAGKLAELKGFGEKTEQRLLLAIDLYETNRPRLLYPWALKKVQRLCDNLLQHQIVKRIEITGELRRACEVIDHIELLAVSDAPETVLEVLSEMGEISSANSPTPQRITATVDRRSKLSLELVPEQDFCPALLFATGPKEHLEILKRRAKAKGLTLTRTQLCSAKRPLTLNSEQDLYHRLGLEFVPPEVRDSQVGAEACFAPGCFDTLIQKADIRGVLHVHTTYSDGKDSIEALALASRELGYEYLGISDHSQSASYAGGMTEDEIKLQHEEIDRLNERLAPFVIFKGIESDILRDGSLDYRDSVLESFDFIIASVHSLLDLTRDDMTSRIARAVENPYTTILGHPTGRLLLRREPYALDLDVVLEAAGNHSTAIEINANPRRLDLDWRLHQQAQSHGIPLPICPDAHSVESLEDLDYGVNIARKGRLHRLAVPNCWKHEQLREYFSSRTMPGEIL